METGKFFQLVDQDIQEQSVKKQQESLAESNRFTAGRELHQALREMTIKYGRSKQYSVEAGSRHEGVMGHRLGDSSRLVAPLVELETPEAGKTNLQLIEPRKAHKDDPSPGFMILKDGKQLIFAKPNGDVTNWKGKPATIEQMILLTEILLPVLEEAYDSLPQLEDEPSIQQLVDKDGHFEGLLNYFYRPEDKGPRKGGRVKMPKRPTIRRVEEGVFEVFPESLRGKTGSPTTRATARRGGHHKGS